MTETSAAYLLSDRHGMLSHDEIDLLQTCVCLLPPNPVLINIGASVGTSAVAMLESRADAFIFSIDKKPRPEEIKAVIDAGLERNRIWRLQGPSQGVGKFWPVHYPVDMVFVDGAHDNEAVIGDITAWKPHIKPGGFMLFHDYHHPNLPGLSPIVDRMMAGCDWIGETRYLVAFRL